MSFGEHNATPPPRPQLLSPRAFGCNDPWAGLLTGKLLPGAQDCSLPPPLPRGHVGCQGSGGPAHPPVETKPRGGSMPTTPACQAAGLPGNCSERVPKRRGHP